VTSAAGVACHVCRASSVEPFPAFAQFRRAASDCRPWPAGGFLGICPACGIVQKLVDQAWRDEAAVIYSKYDLYHQSAGGAEQAVFDQTSGAAAPRSKRILDAVAGLAAFPGGGRMLDVGCGSGAMLRAFSGLGGAWELHGQEPNVKSRESLLKIRGVREIHGGAVADVPGKFDFISIIHALEHVEDPVPFLAGVRDKLSPGGLLLIEVPYFPDNPFDLLIADHCTHFTVATLLPVLAQSGLVPVSARTDVVTKEITVVARLARTNPPAPKREARLDMAAARGMVEDALDWLEKVRAEAKTLSRGENFGVFGTSISANWLLGELDNRIRFFVDEDPNRIGTSYRGFPVHHPEDAPRGSDVFMVLPRPLAEQILARLKPEGARFHVGPAYRNRYAEAPI
jgi:SAM-dependent methyltransferase